MTNNIVMIMVNIFEAKARLSEFVDAIERGERVVICKHNRPVAELRPVAATRTDPRPIGLAKGQLEVPDNFFEPLPDDLLDAFDGTGAARPMKVAEATPPGEYTGHTSRTRSRRR